jgi:pimeloyl-ACP methyl ester carboxylesterase
MNRKLFLILLVIAVATGLVVSGLVFSKGRMVDVGGYKLFLSCRGEARPGIPTVILEAGMSRGNETWGLVYPEIAKLARVCVYDRAGIGKSDRLGEEERTALRMVEDLRTLLQKGEISGPYILVGHSFGGLLVRLYASRFPGEVAAMVLVDSVHEDETREWVKLMPPDIRKQMEESGGKLLPGMEPVNIEASHEQMRAAGWRSDIPLIVLSRGSSSFSVDDYPPQLRSLAPEGEQLRIRMQLDLASRSTNSKHVFAEKSGHMIHQDEPALVIDAIRQVIEAVKREAGKCP